MFGSELNKDEKGNKVVIPPFRYLQAQKEAEKITKWCKDSYWETHSSDSKFVRFASEPIVIPTQDETIHEEEEGRSPPNSSLSILQKETNNAVPMEKFIPIVKGSWEKAMESATGAYGGKPLTISASEEELTLSNRLAAIQEVYKGQAIPIEIEDKDNLRFSPIQSFEEDEEPQNMFEMDPLGNSLCDDLAIQIKNNAEILLALSSRHQKLQESFLRAADNHDSLNEEGSYNQMHYYTKELNLLAVPISLVKSMGDALSSTLTTLQDNGIDRRIDETNNNAMKNKN